MALDPKISAFMRRVGGGVSQFLGNSMVDRARSLFSGGPASSFTGGFRAQTADIDRGNYRGNPADYTGNNMRGGGGFSGLLQNAMQGGGQGFAGQILQNTMQSASQVQGRPGRGFLGRHMYGIAQTSHFGTSGGGAQVLPGSQGTFSGFASRVTEWSDALLSSRRSIMKFNSTLVAAAVRSDRRAMIRNIQSGARTGGATSRLMESRDDLADSLQELRDTIHNVGAKIMTNVNNFTRAALSHLSKIGWLKSIFETIKAWAEANDPKGPLPAQAVLDRMRTLGGRNPVPRDKGRTYRP